MHMVRLYVQLHHCYLFFLLTQLIHLRFGIFSYRFLEYPISIFRTEHNMILALVERM